jgi:hypothetical protein
VEYFCPALLSSKGTLFVPKAGVSYRHTSHLNCLSSISSSNAKKDATLLSMKLEIQHVRTPEGSDRVRHAYLIYTRNLSEKTGGSAASFCASGNLSGASRYMSTRRL